VRLTHERGLHDRAILRLCAAPRREMK
jgi:hypothetical protein